MNFFQLNTSTQNLFDCGSFYNIHLISVCFVFRKPTQEAGRMVQWLKTHTALTEYSSLVLNGFRLGSSQLSVIRLQGFRCPLWSPCAPVLTCTLAYRYSHVIKNKRKFKGETLLNNTEFVLLDTLLKALLWSSCNHIPWKKHKGLFFNRVPILINKVSKAFKGFQAFELFINKKISRESNIQSQERESLV